MDTGSVEYVGRDPTGQHLPVYVKLTSGGYSSDWPEWAYAIAENALHFNKRVMVTYNNKPHGPDLLQVFCLKNPA
jgi:hypothetical protein